VVASPWPSALLLATSLPHGASMLLGSGVGRLIRGRWGSGPMSPATVAEGDGSQLRGHLLCRASGSYASDTNLGLEFLRRCWREVSAIGGE
jgi:hypothetical protein